MWTLNHPQSWVSNSYDIPKSIVAMILLLLQSCLNVELTGIMESVDHVMLFVLFCFISSFSGNYNDVNKEYV